jgi:hypothetical protein
MALKDASLEFPHCAEDIDALIQQRIHGKLKVRTLLPQGHERSPAISLTLTHKHTNQILRALMPALLLPRLHVCNRGQEGLAQG